MIREFANSLRRVVGAWRFELQTSSAQGRLHLTSVPFVPIGEGEWLQRIEGTSLI